MSFPNLKKLAIVSPALVITVFTIWILLAWTHFPNTNDLNQLDYDGFVSEFGTPTYVMPEKGIEWVKKVGLITTLVCISHDANTAGNRTNLLSLKALYLDIFGKKFPLYSES